VQQNDQQYKDKWQDGCHLTAVDTEHKLSTPNDLKLGCWELQQQHTTEPLYKLNTTAHTAVHSVHAVDARQNTPAGLWSVKRQSEHYSLKETAM